MSKSIRFEIVTPVRAVYSGVVKAVILPTSLGEIEVLEGHQALLALIDHGTVIAKELDGSEKAFVTERGYVETVDDTVTLLVSGCKSVDEVDIEAANDALKKGEEALAGGEEFSEDAMAHARDQYAKARAELDYVERFGR